MGPGCSHTQGGCARMSAHDLHTTHKLSTYMQGSKARSHQWLLRYHYTQQGRQPSRSLIWQTAVCRTKGQLGRRCKSAGTAVTNAYCMSSGQISTIQCSQQLVRSCFWLGGNSVRVLVWCRSMFRQVQSMAELIGSNGRADRQQGQSR